MNVVLGKYPEGDEDRLIHVHIDPWDTWSMDETLALIVLPMLIQLKDTKHGSPYIEDVDVPHLPKQGNTSDGSMQYDMFASDEHDDLVWSQFEKRWNWVLDEMIFAFENTNNTYELSVEECERVQNGFRLFGKYFNGLWD